MALLRASYSSPAQIDECESDIFGTSSWTLNFIGGLGSEKVGKDGNSNLPFIAGAVPVSTLRPAILLWSFRRRSGFDMGIIEAPGLQCDRDVGCSPLL